MSEIDLDLTTGTIESNGTGDGVRVTVQTRTQSGTRGWCSKLTGLREKPRSILVETGDRDETLALRSVGKIDRQFLPAEHDNRSRNGRGTQVFVVKTPGVYEASSQIPRENDRRTFFRVGESGSVEILDRDRALAILQSNDKTGQI